MFANIKRFEERKIAQKNLRDLIALWAGYKLFDGLSDFECHQEFVNLFEIDVLSAQALKTKAAAALSEQIRRELELERKTHPA